MLPSPAWKTLAMRRSYFADAAAMRAQDVGQLGARHDAVLGAVVRRQRPTAPKARLRHFHSSAARLSSAASGLRARCSRGRSRDAIRAWRVGVIAETVDLDDQHGAGVEREAEVERRLDRLDRSFGPSSPGPPGRYPPR